MLQAFNFCLDDSYAVKKKLQSVLQNKTAWSELAVYIILELFTSTSRLIVQFERLITNIDKTRWGIKT